MILLCLIGFATAVLRKFKRIAINNKCFFNWFCSISEKRKSRFFDKSVNQAGEERVVSSMEEQSSELRLQENKH